MVQSLHLHTLPLRILHPYQWQLDKPIYYMVWPNTLSCQWGKCVIVDVPLHSHQTRSPSNMTWPQSGFRPLVSSPWSNPSPNAPPPHTTHNVYDKKSIQDKIACLHACCFSHVQDTWIKAIENRHFATWPALMVDNVRKYLPEYDAMVKGQIQQNIRSTQPKVTAPAPEPDMAQEDKCRYVYLANMETQEIYTDLTGRFLTTSLSGNKYILVLYYYNSNSVLSVPTKTGDTWKWYKPLTYSSSP
jgi:hypothetical protein